jgi:ribonuclease HII
MKTGNKRFSESLFSSFTSGALEAGVDEAGRGALAGPVVAAAVILSPDFSHSGIRDSKLLTSKERLALREYIQENALTWGLGVSGVAVIDSVNILNAAFAAMNEALAALACPPELILVDGNRFRTTLSIPYRCLIGGDRTYLSIAAASILAKTYRDEIMEHLSQFYPAYGWDENKGYPTTRHRTAIAEHGLTPWHRSSFRQLKN